MIRQTQTDTYTYKEWGRAMILIDANLLIYAYVPSFPQHDSARTWINAVLSSTDRVGIPWASSLAFTRIVTNSKIIDSPASMIEAWAAVRSWLDCRHVWIPEPTTEHADRITALLPAMGSRSNLVPDAHLAALAISHGLTLCSADGDFARFARVSALQWQNPLSSMT